jgi:hypothetical protein
MCWINANLSCAALFIILVLSNTAARAQEQTLRDVVIQTNRQELDNLLLRKPILTVEDKSARQAVLKQINDDFKALQVLNNRAMSAVTVETEVDYRSLASLISEIGSKASRLKSNLVLPKIERSEEKLADPVSTAVQFRERMMSFDKVVMSFATNKIFSEANVIDVELAKMASRDLTAIIEQSGKLKKAASELAKKK